MATRRGRNRQSDWLDEQQRSKAMNNPIVLGKISQMLPASTLLPLRSTCRMWNQNFIPQVRKKHDPICLTVAPTPPSTYPSWYLDTEDEHAAAGTLDEFVSAMQGSLAILFSNYKVIAGRYPKSRTPRPKCKTASAQHLRAIDSFLTLVGNAMTKLHVTWKTLNTLPMATFREMLFQRLPNLKSLTLEPSTGTIGFREGVAPSQSPPLMGPLPKLKKLKVTTEGGGIDQEFSVLIADIAQSAPELKELKFSEAMSYRQYVEPVLAAFQSVNHVLKLRVLKIGEVTSEILQSLLDLTKRKELRLNSFKCEFEIDYRESEEEEVEDGGGEVASPARLVYLFKDVLLGQGSSLRILGIKIDCYNFEEYENQDPRPAVPIPIPHMEGLQCLTMERNSSDVQPVIFEGGTLQETFPQLLTLKYYHEPGDDTANLDSDMAQMAHTGVKQLKVVGIEGALRVQLPAMFPSATLG